MRDIRAGLILAALLVATLFTLAGAASRDRVTLTRHFDPPQGAEGRYQYVPFMVPRGTTSLRVAYRFDRADGDNVVDLGVFEPGSLDLNTPAFRGYSGGAKAGFVISPAETTTGYRPGPLPPGEWHLLLGLYKVRPGGVDVTLTIDTEAGPAPAASRRPPPGAPARLVPVAPANVAGRWLTGALHTHTLHSDGTLSPPDLLRMFGDAGFDFVVITDHNNTTHRHELAARAPDARPLWIVGEEVTTPGGHASVWGLRDGGWVDFRVAPGDRRIADLVASAHRQGALFSINHPTSTCLACGWTHAVVDGIDGIEISNGRHGEVAEALARWDAVLQSGRRITGVGSSDWHAAPAALDDAHVRVRAAALTQAAVLDAIRGGRVIVMRSRTAETPGITARAGETTAGVGDSLRIGAGSEVTLDVQAPGLAGGRAVVVLNGRRAATTALDGAGVARVTLAAAPGYVRVEIHGADGQLHAIVNPVYLVR